jgi:nucleoside-diphosphate-sugar epimerase
MKILLTGAGGFLGKAICQKLSAHEIVTLGRQNADIEADLSEEIIPQLPRCELVIHAAGKAHMVPKTAAEKDDFFKVNVQGTIHLLEALEQNAIPQKIVFISSVAVYGATNGTHINEMFPLLASDPYGKSKIEAEKIIIDWSERNKVRYTILRLPLLIGRDAPGNLGSMIRAIQKGYYFNIGDGKAKKSMVLADDVADAITRVAEIGGVYNLTDGNHPSIYELSNVLSHQLGQRKAYKLPVAAARGIAFIGNFLGNNAPINSAKLQKLTSSLTFDDSKARKAFDWSPQSVLDTFKA